MLSSRGDTQLYNLTQVFTSEDWQDKEELKSCPESVLFDRSDITRKIVTSQMFAIGFVYCS
jgi:hypothetical protein